MIAYELGSPMIYVRSEAKSHGLGRVVGGFLRPGSYILIDDVATTGGSLESAAEILKDLGSEVRYAFVLVDRLQGAGERLSRIGIELFSLITLRDIIDIGYRAGLISPNDKEAVYRYMGWEDVEE